jgi:prephenate dehydrogenase
MWADIFENNKVEVLNHLTNYQQELESIKDLIKNDDKVHYQQYFESAKNNRDKWI